MHYRNGREAKVGDLVVGRTYNVMGLVAGTLVSLTPGLDTCSAKVGFVKTVLLKEAQSVLSGAPHLAVLQGTQQHGGAGPLAVSVYSEDYTEAGNLLHADDVCWVNEAGGTILLAPAPEAA